MSTRINKTPLIIQPVWSESNGQTTMPTPLTVIQSTISLYRNSNISDKELAEAIEDNLDELMRVNNLKIISAGPHYSVLGSCGQLLFKESDNSSYYPEK